MLTSSITGPHVTSPGHGHYSATKAGINGFIRAAARSHSVKLHALAADVGVHVEVGQVGPAGAPDARVEDVVRDRDHLAVEPRGESEVADVVGPVPLPPIWREGLLGLELAALLRYELFRQPPQAPAPRPVMLIPGGVSDERLEQLS